MASSIRSQSSNALARLACLMVAVAVAGPALGKDAAEIRAREQFRVGQTAYAAGEYERALTAFSSAYGLQPVPGLLFNIAQCHRQLGNYERAAVFYQQYLDLSPSSKNTSIVRALLAETQASERERKRRLEEQEKLRSVKLQISDIRPLQDPFARDGRASEVVRSGSSNDSIFQKWWFWTGVGAITIGSTAYLLSRPRSPDSLLGTANTR